MAETSIEWTDHSINPIRFGRGHFCQKLSPGCTNCYASDLQRRFNNPGFKGTGGPLPMAVNEQGPRGQSLWLDESKLREVLRRKKPTKYFWCDMTDLFGSWVPDEWIDACFATMALTPQHTHQVLTKRADRMRDYFAERWQSPKYPPVEEDRPRECDEDRQDRVLAETSRLLMGKEGDDPRFWTPDGKNIAYGNPAWPLSNVWLGVSAEDQQRADERVPLLLQTPAAVRFLSCEPLLGPVDLVQRFNDGATRNWLDGQYRGLRATSVKGDQEIIVDTEEPKLPRIGWVIVGGESGPGARPCNVAWVRSIIGQCKAAGVACFVKQLGSAPRDNIIPDSEEPVWDDASLEYTRDPLTARPNRLRLSDRKGGDPAEWPEDLRIRQFPEGVPA